MRPGYQDLRRAKLLGRALFLMTIIATRWRTLSMQGRIPAVHGVVRWRIIDLVQWLWDEFEISISKQALGHELRTMGYRKLSARPRHRGQKGDDIAVFKKTSQPVWRKSATASPKERP